MVQQETVHGTVAALDEHFLKAVLVEALDARFAPVTAAKELDVGVRVVGEHVNDFVVEAFVEVVAVLEVNFPDLGLVW